MEVNSRFDMEEFSRSQRAMKCARQLFPHSGQQEAWAISALQRWQNKVKHPKRRGTKGILIGGKRLKFSTVDPKPKSFTTHENDPNS